MHRKFFMDLFLFGSVDSNDRFFLFLLPNQFFLRVFFSFTLFSYCRNSDRVIFLFVLFCCRRAGRFASQLGEAAAQQWAQVCRRCDHGERDANDGVDVKRHRRTFDREQDKREHTHFRRAQQEVSACIFSCFFLSRLVKESLQQDQSTTNLR